MCTGEEVKITLNKDHLTDPMEILRDSSISSIIIKDPTKTAQLIYPDIEKVSEGIYRVEPGQYTGKEGWEQFNKALEEQFKK